MATARRSKGDGAVRELSAVLRATWSNLRSQDRATRIVGILRTWAFSAKAGLPKRPLADIFPGIEHVRCGATPANRHFFELPYGERFVLDVIARHVGATRLFEFGTFRGTTTRLLADAAGPDGVVHTIDLPRADGVDDRADVIGAELHDLPADAADVVQHRADTAHFDFTPYVGSFDLVLLDASHKHDDVLRDSRNALRLVRPGGVVVWDDYHAGEPGVVRALRDLSHELPIVNVRWTRLAVLPYQ